MPLSGRLGYPFEVARLTLEHVQYNTSADGLCQKLQKVHQVSAVSQSAGHVL